MLVTQVKKDKKTLKPINLKVDADVREALQKQADTYAEGNLSEWLRFAGLHFKPGKEHLAPSSKKKK